MGLIDLIQSPPPASQGYAGTFMGIDLGRKHDSTAIAVVERDREGIVKLLGLRELRAVPSEEQIAEIKRLSSKYRPVAIYVDETGMGLPISERLQRELGARVEGITFTQNSKAELVAKTQVLLQDKKLKYAPHPRLREQLHSITKNVTAEGRILYRTDSSQDLTGEHHGDLAWALMLAVLASSTGFRPGFVGILAGQPGMAEPRIIGLKQPAPSPGGIYGEIVQRVSDASVSGGGPGLITGKDIERAVRRGAPWAAELAAARTCCWGLIDAKKGTHCRRPMFHKGDHAAEGLDGMESHHLPQVVIFHRYELAHDVAQVGTPKGRL